MTALVHSVVRWHRAFIGSLEGGPVMADYILAAVVAPVFVAPVVRAAVVTHRFLVGTDTCGQAVLRWHRAFTWPQRIGIALLLANGLGHLWLVLR